MEVNRPTTENHCEVCAEHLEELALEIARFIKLAEERFWQLDARIASMQSTIERRK